MQKKTPLIIPELENKKIDIVVVEERAKNKIPNEYIPVRLCTHGLLDTPKILHYRDYSMQDALDLNTIEDDEQSKAMVNVLNSMVLEDFDHNNMNPKELMELLLIIHGTFISTTIEKDYYLDENLPEGNGIGQLDSEENINTVDLSINKLNVRKLNQDSTGNQLEKKFKEPFNIKDSFQYLNSETSLTEYRKTIITVRLPRMKDIIFCKEYCDEKFYEPLRTWAPFRREIEKIRKLKNRVERESQFNKLIEDDWENWEKYQKFLGEYAIEQAKVMQAQLIVAVNGEQLNTFEEKYDAYKNKISSGAWKFYDTVTSEYNFGIESEIEFFSEKLNKSVTRRFLFRISDGIPTNSEKDSRRFTVEFD